MKTLTNLILAVVLITANLYPSAGPPPPPPLFKAKYQGAVYQSPLITGRNTSALFARISYVSVSELDGKINLEGTSTNLQGIVDGKNFEWQTPAIIFNMGLVAAPTKNTALIINLGVHQIKTIKLSGIEIAYCGVLVNQENHKLRLALGINIHPREFQWYTYSEDTYNKGKGMDYDPTIRLTYNSDFKNWIVNPFIQLSYSTQTLFDTGDKEYSSEVYKNFNVFSFTPGISYDWNENLRSNLGITISFVDKIENSKSFVLTPQFQLSYYFY